MLFPGCDHCLSLYYYVNRGVSDSKNFHFIKKARNHKDASSWIRVAQKHTNVTCMVPAFQMLTLFLSARGENQSY